MPVLEYCKTKIDPAVAEIDNVGLSALVDVLINPAGISVEVIYLDRSAGEDVTTYRFAETDEEGNELLPDAPTFRLLYRP
jgi:ubiquitin thioesterase protein OTUB1